MVTPLFSALALDASDVADDGISIKHGAGADRISGGPASDSEE